MGKWGHEIQHVCSIQLYPVVAGDSWVFLTESMKPLWLSFKVRRKKKNLVLQVKCLGMTARWSGVSAPTVSTCTVSWNGWTHSRCSSSAPCADRSGSSKSDAPPSPLLRPDHRFKSVVNSCVFCIFPSDVMLWTILLTDLINENLKTSIGLLLCLITCDTLLHGYGWIFSLDWSFFLAAYDLISVCSQLILT